MTKSKRIKPIVNLAENHEKAAARELGDRLKNLDFHEKRLEELLQYREEYHRKLSGAQGLDARALQEYHIFLARLNEAIHQQKKLVQQAGKERDDSRETWLGKRTRTQALNKVVDRYRADELKQAERKEQKETDEFAGRSKPDKFES